MIQYRVLCLHGYRQDAVKLRGRIAALRRAFKSSVEFGAQPMFLTWSDALTYYVECFYILLLHCSMLGCSLHGTFRRNSERLRGQVRDLPAGLTRFDSN